MDNYKEKSLLELLEIAKSRVPDIPSGDIFIVADLFLGYQWRQIDLGNRKKLGLLFNIWATTEVQDTLTALKEKSAQKQQRYEKV